MSASVIGVKLLTEYSVAAMLAMLCCACFSSKETDVEFASHNWTFNGSISDKPISV